MLLCVSSIVTLFVTGWKEGKRVFLEAGEGRRQEGEELLIHLHVSTFNFHTLYLDCSCL